MKNFLSLDEISSMEHLTVHATPLGEVAFMVPAYGELPEDIEKGGKGVAHVSAHYRRTKDGKLVFVAGYSKEYDEADDDPTVQLWHPSKEELHSHFAAQQEAAKLHNAHIAKDPWKYKADGTVQYVKGKPVKDVKKKVYEEDELTDKYVSFHFGDEVFIKYSHMHDAHYGIGVVVGIRSDSSHEGKLIRVKFPHTKEVKSIAPQDLVHVHKVDAEKRQDEDSTMVDDAGHKLDYQHMTKEQRQRFYDLYWLFNTAYKMSMDKAWKDHWQEFHRSPQYMKENKLDTEYPEYALLRFENSKGIGEITRPGGMTLKELEKFEEIIQKNEQGNYIPLIPVATLREIVTSQNPLTGGEYDNKAHFKKCAELVSKIKKYESEGIQIWQNKVFVPNSKKEMPKIMSMFEGAMSDPSLQEFGLLAKPVVVGSKDEYDPEDFYKLKQEMYNLVGHDMPTPDAFGEAIVNPIDEHYSHSILIKHGQVKPAPEGGVKIPPAPKVTPLTETGTTAKTTFVQPVPPPKPPVEKKEEGKKEAAKPAEAKEPELIVPAAPEKPKAEEPAHVVHAGEAMDISDLHFSFVNNAELEGFGGAHSKYVFEGSDGKKYLFKPFADEEGHRVWAEIIPAVLAESAGHPSAKFGSKPVVAHIPSSAGGSYAGMKVAGSMQRIISEVKKHHIKGLIHEGTPEDWAKVPKEVVEQLQRESVIDWLTGNHDPHAGQFIIDKAGNLIGIDKGQAFKFYGEDKLSIDYNPNFQYEGTQLYNRMYAAAKEGKIDLDFGVVDNFIKQIKKNVSVLKWMNMVKPFAEQSHKWADKVYQFQNIASNRYGNLESDFKKLYKSFGAGTEIDEKTKKYAKPEPAVKKQPTKEYDPLAFMQLDHAFHTKVHQAQALGHSVLMGGGDVRDMDVTFTKYEWDDAAKKLDSDRHEGLEVAMELMPHAEQKIMPFFHKVEDQQTDFINETGTLPLEHDPIAPMISMVAKTINTHAADGKYNMTTLSQFAKWFQQSVQETADGEPAIFDINKPVISPAELAMKLQHGFVTSKNYEDWVTMSKTLADHYHKIATEMYQAIKTQSKTPSKNYEAWSGTYKIKKQKTSKQKHPIATHPNFYLDQKTGKLMRTHGEKNTWMPNVGSFYGAESLKPYGAMLSKDLPGNIQIRYYPHYSQSLKYAQHDGQNNLRSQQGRLVLDFGKWDGNVDAMHEAREILKQIGLDHKLSNHTDLEVMYLTRIAWHQKGDRDEYGNIRPEWKKIQGMENDEKKVQALKDYCAKLYGKHPDQLTTYDPVPKWDLNHTNSGSSGHHYWMNPYVLDYIKSNPNKLMMPIHHLTAAGSKSKEALTCMALFGLQATEERVKYVLPPGSSSAEDQRTGGAQSVFIKGSATKNDPDKAKLVKQVGYDHLVFKPELFARMDSYHYDDDNYGSTYEQEGLNRSPIWERIPVMDAINGDKYSSMFEVMFRHAVSFDTWLLGSNYDYESSWPTLLKEAIKKHKPHLLNDTYFLVNYPNKKEY